MRFATELEDHAVLKKAGERFPSGFQRGFASHLAEFGAFDRGTDLFVKGRRFWHLPDFVAAIMTGQSVPRIMTTMNIDLPPPIAAFFKAFNANDEDAFLGLFTEDALVTDEGHE